jgi:hypothetical protein
MYKFRKSMNLYRQSAIKIQQWTRQMRSRYEFIKLKRSVQLIQFAYRTIYMKKRNVAAAKIQSLWRMHHARKQYLVMKHELKRQMEIRREQALLNLSATRIQSTWRGYRLRKLQTNTQINTIRTRLSIYQANTSSSAISNATLGARIRKSLETLKYPCVPIQQIMQALHDLHKVTKLSPECCCLFTREGAIDILYNFIQNCNRSVPHMDLVRLCLDIFINLAKYSQTYEFILSNAQSMNIFMNLLQAYYVSNANIFMNVCIIFIILAKYESTKNYLIEQDGFIKKLEGIYQALERRAQYSHKIPNAKDMLANNVIETSTVKKNTIISFSLSAEWVLAKKEYFEVVNSIGAMELLLRLLNSNFVPASSLQQQQQQHSSSNLTLGSKTPRKNAILQQKSIDSANKPKIPTTQSLDSIVKTSSSSAKSVNKGSKLENLYNHQTIASAAKKASLMPNHNQQQQHKTGSASSKELFNMRHQHEIPNQHNLLNGEDTIYYESEELMINQDINLPTPDESYFTALTATQRTTRLRATQSNTRLLNSTLNHSIVNHNNNQTASNK